MISIIIPVFNEEKTLPVLLNYLINKSDGFDVEILVVDGGSSDNTKEISSKLGATVLISPRKGRARQMNWGAKHAKGEVLYFLHADTFPPSGFLLDIKDALKNGVGAGCFRLTFDADHTLLKFYSWFTRFDIDLFRFGDQSLFVKKSVFEKVGGFDESLIVMEDQVVIPLLKKEAEFRILKKCVVTSARKYLKVGIIKLQIVFAVIVLLFYLGVEQKKIIQFYKHYIS